MRGGLVKSALRGCFCAGLLKEFCRLFQGLGKTGEQIGDIHQLLALGFVAAAHVIGAQTCEGVGIEAANLGVCMIEGSRN
jgi:hypothetical protein